MRIRQTSVTRLWLPLGCGLCLFVMLGLQLIPQESNTEPQQRVSVLIEPRSHYATWPWANMRGESIHKGVTLFTATDPADGTGLHLFRFDAADNPKLRFELYDADEDDEKPNDDRVIGGRKNNTTWAWHRLARARGNVIAVFNGPFFNITDDYSHTATVVRLGNVFCNVGNPRWAVGAVQTPRGSEFHLVHRATREQLDAFDWGSGNVQALIVNSKPTQVPPPSSEIPGEQSPESQPDDCGPYPLIDYLKTSRTSLGWRGHEFCMLIVTQSPTESEDTSFNLRRAGQHQHSGWDLADLQQFWTAYRAEGACNLDGGHCTQVCYSSRSGMRFLGDNFAAPVPIDSPRARAEVGVLLFPYVRE